MKYILGSFLLGTIFFFQSCNDNSSVKYKIAQGLTIDSINYLKGNIIKKGDIHSYEELMSIYLIENKLNEFLIYSFIMSQNYDYPKASYDVYFIITNCLQDFQTSEKKINSKINTITFLEKSASLGYEPAIVELRNHFSDSSKTVIINKE